MPHVTARRLMVNQQVKQLVDDDNDDSDSVSDESVIRDAGKPYILY